MGKGGDLDWDSDWETLPPTSPHPLLIQAWYQVCNALYIVVGHQVLCSRALAGHVGLCLLQTGHTSQSQDRGKPTILAEQDIRLQPIAHHEDAGRVHMKALYNAVKHIRVRLPHHHRLAPRGCFHCSCETPCPWEREKQAFTNQYEILATMGLSHQTQGRNSRRNACYPRTDRELAALPVTGIQRSPACLFEAQCTLYPETEEEHCPSYSRWALMVRGRHRLFVVCL